MSMSSTRRWRSPLNPQGSDALTTPTACPAAFGCRRTYRIALAGPRRNGERLADPGSGVAAPERPVVTAGVEAEHRRRESRLAQLGRELDILLAEERVVGADVERAVNARAIAR